LDPAIVKDILASTAIIAAFIIAGRLLILIIDKVVRKVTDRTRLGDMLLGVVERPAFYLLVLWGVYISLHRLSVELANSVLALVDKAVFIITVALVVKVVYDLLGQALEWHSLRAAERGHEDIGRYVTPLLKKLVKIFVILSGLIVILDHFNYNITSLVTALGVSSLAIGLAAKETLSNMISGFVIVADRPFRVGDRIEVGGKTGDVKEIGIRSTRMTTLEGTMVVIPNSQLVDNAVVNHTHPEYSLDSSLNIRVEYGTEVEKVKEVLKGVTAAVPGIMAAPAPDVFFAEHGEYAMIFQLNYRVSDYALKPAVADKLNTLVNRRFKEQGISFAYPTRNVYLRGPQGAGALNKTV